MLAHRYPTRITDDNVYSLLSYNIGYLSGLTNNRAVVRDPDFQQANMQSLKQRLDELGADILAVQEIDYQGGSVVQRQPAKRNCQTRLQPRRPSGQLGR